MTAFAYLLNAAKSTGAKYIINAEDLVNPLALQAKVLARATEGSHTLEVETLPFFKLSTTYFRGRPALVLGNLPPVLGAEPEAPRAVTTFYSGMYIIDGWEHEISASNVSSTFYLIKSVSTLSKEQMGAGV